MATRSPLSLLPARGTRGLEAKGRGCCSRRSQRLCAVNALRSACRSACARLPHPRRGAGLRPSFSAGSRKRGGLSHCAGLKRCTRGSGWLRAAVGALHRQLPAVSSSPAPRPGGLPRREEHETLKPTRLCLRRSGPAPCPGAPALRGAPASSARPWPHCRGWGAAAALVFRELLRFYE